jgi:hypothetical protein
MRRCSAIFACLIAAFTAALACSIEQTGASRPDAGTASGGSDGGQVISTGTCFPGAKACPDTTGELVCEDANDPASGCKGSTACAPCVLPHAQAKCSDPLGCDIGACDSGWNDCNTDPSDGCETSLQNDPLNCGGCGTDCSAGPIPGAVCIEGACVENPCSPPTTGNCDKNPANGCEVDLTSDLNNCSFCGNNCVLPHATSKCEAEPSGYPVARCAVDKCDAGWFDCDGKAANGCESSASTDPSSCGGCGKKCNSTNGTAGCVNGVCDLLCNTGFGNCDNDKDNGCETDLSAHVSHCGACGNACSATNGTPTCVGGKCATGGCTAGWSDCDAVPGCETDTNTDPKHCGACAKNCPGTANGFATCAAGACGLGCSAGFSTCGTGTTCFDTTTDATHCGASCAACPGPASGSGAAACQGGSCSITCASGLTKCGGRCVDLQTTADSCGVCGKVCTAALGGTASCVAGQCVASCPTNVAVCNDQCVDVYTNSSHCGQCNKKCGTNQKCESGSCACQWSTAKNCGTYCALCCKNQDCGGNSKCYFGVCV